MQGRQAISEAGGASPPGRSAERVKSGVSEARGVAPWPERRAGNTEPRWNRTNDPLVKSQMLYRLS